jgi:cell division protease FtsH
MGGRSSEGLTFNEMTTGANNDLERATELAREMVTRYGMSERLGPLTFGNKHQSIFLGKALAEDRNYSEEVASIIDEEVRRIVGECHEKARSIITANKKWMDYISEVLIEQETLDRKDFERLMQQLDAEHGTPGGTPAVAPTDTPQPGTLELGMGGSSS